MKSGRKIIVVGGNAAGAAAAAKAKRARPDAEVFLLEKSDAISTATCLFPYLISGEVNQPEDLRHFTAEEFLREKGVGVFLQHEVTGINRRQKSLLCNDFATGTRHEFCYDTLILCTGSIQRPLSGIENGLENVFTYKSFYDVRRWHEFSVPKRVLRVAIIGAGFLGLEIADTLTKAGHSVTLISDNKYPAVSADEISGELLLSLCRKNNVGFIPSTSLSFSVLNKKITAVRADGRFIETDAVFNTTGFLPSTGLASASGLRLGTSGGIKVSSRLQTSDMDIFAAGDCIEFSDSFSGNPFTYSSAVFAHESGHVAGLNAAGVKKTFHKFIKCSIARAFGCYIAKTGTSGEGIPFIDSVHLTVLNRSKHIEGAANSYCKLYFSKKTGTIVGSYFLGGEEVAGYSDIVSALIEKNAHVEDFARISFAYTPTVSNLIHPLARLGRLAEKKCINKGSL